MGGWGTGRRNLEPRGEFQKLNADVTQYRHDTDQGPSTVTIIPILLC